MKNYVQPGHVVTVTAPTGGVKSGDAILVGSLFGVCAHDADEGASVELAVTGVFEMPSDGTAFAEGAKVYWNNTTKQAVSTASGNTLIGHALAAGAATVTVRLAP